MHLPKSIDLFYVPAAAYVEARVVELTPQLIANEMGDRWWCEAGIDDKLAVREIDRNWDWTTLEIERRGKVLESQRIAVVTGDGAVQGAALFSIEPVECEIETGERALFLELLFTARRNRHWIRRDRTEQFRGVGLELLRWIVEASQTRGYQGRVKLDSSPDFVDWYAKRGLQRTSEEPILHEGVSYAPMELTSGAAQNLLFAQKKGASSGGNAT